MLPLPDATVQFNIVKILVSRRWTTDPTHIIVQIFTLIEWQHQNIPLLQAMRTIKSSIQLAINRTIEVLNVQIGDDMVDPIEIERLNGLYWLLSSVSRLLSLHHIAHIAI